VTYLRKFVHYFTWYRRNTQ